LFPSAEETTRCQDLFGALVGVQFWANAELTTMDRPTKIATAGKNALIDFAEFAFSIYNHRA
jgi:hypothetical protein